MDDKYPIIKYIDPINPYENKNIHWMTIEEVIEIYGHILTEYEINKIKEIWKMKA